MGGDLKESRQTRFVTCFIIALLYGGMNLAWPPCAQGLQPEDYLSIRILQPPFPHPPKDPTRCTPLWGQTCGPGPAYPAGITDAGDVFGHIETNYPHVHHFEEGIRWLRRDNYMGDNVGKPEVDASVLDFEGNLLPFGRAYGLHSHWVTPDGYATGSANINNSYTIHYDIVNDRWWVLGKGAGEKGYGSKSLSKEVTIGMGGPANGYYARVSDVTRVEPPFTDDDRGELQRLPDRAYVVALNKDDVIVGMTDPSCLPTFPLCFGDSTPIKFCPPDLTSGVT